MGVKGCKKATRHKDPKGKGDGGLPGIFMPRQLVDPPRLRRDRRDVHTLHLASSSWQMQALLLFGQTPPHTRVDFSVLQ